MLFRLVEELVQDDPAHWEKELDYSYLWERLAGMFQFYSAHYRMDGTDWIAEHAPRGGSMMRAAWEAIPELRLDATACEAPVNYGVLVNARRIFGAVLSGKVQWLADHSFPNAQLWPLEGFSGTVDAIDIPNNSAQVTVSMFGRETSVDFELDQLEKVKD